MTGLVVKLGTILSRPFYRRLAVGIGAVYLLLFLVGCRTSPWEGAGFSS